MNRNSTSSFQNCRKRATISRYHKRFFLLMILYMARKTSYSDLSLSLSKISPSQHICFLWEYVIPCRSLKFKQQCTPFCLLYKTFAQHTPECTEDTFISPMHILSLSAVYFSFENGRSFGRMFPTSVLINFAN